MPIPRKKPMASAITLLLLLLDEKCFGLNYVIYSGEELEKALGKGMPDYYLRYRNRVFGCKDVQIAAKKKLSSDYKTIKNNF